MACPLTDIDKITAVPDTGQDASAGIAESKHPCIGRRALHHFQGDTKVGTKDHPVNTGAGIALGFGSGDDLFQRSELSARVHQLAPQSLRAVGQRGKFPVGHGAQAVKDGFFALLQRMHRRTGEYGSGFHGDVVCPFFSVYDQLAQGSGRRILRVCRKIVIIAATVKDDGLQMGVLRQNCFAVFHSQNVVGGCKQLPIQSAVRNSGSPGGREG